MIIGSISENTNIEKRVAITPDIIKKYTDLGLEIYLCKDYATHLGINDRVYEDNGAKIINSQDEIILKAKVLIQMNIPNDEKLSKFQKDQILIGVLNPYSNEKN